MKDKNDSPEATPVREPVYRVDLQLQCSACGVGLYIPLTPRGMSRQEGKILRMEVQDLCGVEIVCTACGLRTCVGPGMRMAGDDTGGRQRAEEFRKLATRRKSGDPVLRIRRRRNP